MIYIYYIIINTMINIKLTMTLEISCLAHTQIQMFSQAGQQASTLDHMSHNANYELH